MLLFNTADNYVYELTLQTDVDPLCIELELVVSIQYIPKWDLLLKSSFLYEGHAYVASLAGYILC